MYEKKRKKYLIRSSHGDGKREIACSDVETATGKHEKWRENRGHVVIFTVRVSRMRDAKSLVFSSDVFFVVAVLAVYSSLMGKGEAGGLIKRRILMFEI